MNQADVTLGIWTESCGIGLCFRLFVAGLQVQYDLKGQKQQESIYSLMDCFAVTTP